MKQHQEQYERGILSCPMSYVSFRSCCFAFTEAFSFHSMLDAFCLLTHVFVAPAAGKKNLGTAQNSAHKLLLQWKVRVFSR